MVMAQYERERARRVLVLNSGCLNCWAFADDVPPFRMGFRPAILASQQFLWVASCTMSDTAFRLLTNGVAKPHSQTATNHPTPIISHFLLLSPMIPIVSYSLLLSPMVSYYPLISYSSPFSSIICYHLHHYSSYSQMVDFAEPVACRNQPHFPSLGASWGRGGLEPWTPGCIASAHGSRGIPGADDSDAALRLPLDSGEDSGKIGQIWGIIYLIILDIYIYIII